MKTFEIPSVYKSSVISNLKEKRRVADKLKKDFSPSKIKLGNVELIISRHFGFCYGVENAVEIAYKTINENKSKKIYLLSEMIHNPGVNEDLQSQGVAFLMDTKGNELIPIDNLSKNDIVIVPAFGTTLEIENKLKTQGIDLLKYNTTCPFVEKVWNKAAQIGERGYTVIVHGKPSHEETRATFSHSQDNTKTVVVNDMNEAIKLAEYIRVEKTNDEFKAEFGSQASDGFDVNKDLVRFGVVNQTTMLASETQAIADYLKNELINHYNLSVDQVPAHYASTRDTLCYATNDNQDATKALCEEEADFAVVIGGYNSSNTIHLVELLEEKFKTFFIENQSKLELNGGISHFDIHQNKIINSELPKLNEKGLKIIVTCGASCPDAVVESTIKRIMEVYNITISLEKAINEI